MIMQVWKRCLPDALPMKEKTSLTVFHHAGSDFNGWWKRTGKYCVEVLAELGIDDIPVCGMVKDDHHRTRGLYYNNLEIPIDTSSEASA